MMVASETPLYFSALSDYGARLEAASPSAAGGRPGPRDSAPGL